VLALRPHSAGELIFVGVPQQRELSAQTCQAPPTYVKAYVRRQKNDAADAEAICEAVTRPSMRFVPVKTTERQSVLVLHRTRDLLVHQRTTLSNAIRGHCAEFGMIAPQGARRSAELVEQVRHANPCRLPALAQSTLLMMADQLQAQKVASMPKRSLKPSLPS
jgi:transposase